MKMLNKLKEYSVLNVKSIKEKVLEKIKEFRRKLKREKILNDPFFENREMLKKRKKNFEKKNFFIEDFKKDLKGYEELEKIVNRKIIDLNFFRKEAEKLEEKALKKIKTKKALAVEYNKSIQKEIKLNRKLLLNKWEKDLNYFYKEWEEEFEKEKEEKFLKELKEYLDKLQEVYDVMQKANLGNGMLFSFEEGILSERDLEEVLKWAEFIKNNQKVKELCDLLGRLKKASKHKKQEMAKKVKEIKRSIKVSTSKNEINGIKLDDKIEYALPFELSLMSDEDFSILFDKKFIEKSLLCFDTRVIGEIDKEISEKKEIEEMKEEEEKLGPIVLCVDTSGSMSGEPEAIAKAVTLSIASRAKEQNRNCFLINFSTNIEIFDFSKKLGIKDLVAFLKKSFHGGTDITPALNFALDKFKDKEYKNGDLLVISDFQMPEISNNLKKKVKFAKKNKNRFYSLVIGNYRRMANKIFDKEWFFDLYNKDLVMLDEISERLIYGV
jgi:uncharacterized protein with von Willebrand factor type A (vWA) domain